MQLVINMKSMKRKKLIYFFYTSVILLLTSCDNKYDDLLDKLEPINTDIVSDESEYYTQSSKYGDFFIYMPSNIQRNVFDSIFVFIEKERAETLYKLLSKKKYL